MIRTIVIILLLFVTCLSVNAQQVISQTSTHTDQHADGLYYLVPGGDPAEISRICSYGDCGKGFNTPVDALNYWVSLMSQRYGISIDPIPPAPSVSERPTLQCIGNATCMASVWTRYKGV